MTTTTRSSAPATAQKRSEVAIVSAFGRGDWLANELGHRGWKVTLIDVSEALRSCEPEDSEGPFGWFEAADLLPSQAPFHMDSEEMLACDRGFTIWLKDGPIEFRSQLTDFHLRKITHRGVTAEVERYLRHQGLPTPQAVRDLKTISNLEFRDAWVAHLAHQLAAPAAVENHRALEFGWALPVFAPLWIRRASKKGSLASLSHAHTAGAQVITGFTPQQIHFEGVNGGRGHRKNIDAIEFTAAELRSHALDENEASAEHAPLRSAAKVFIWTLTSSESAQLSPQIAATLFPKGSIEPQWFWARHKVELTAKGGSTPKDSLPAFAVVIDDPFLPWNGSNLFILRQRKEPLSYDAWTRLPIRAVNDQTYLAKIGDEIERQLQTRLPSFEPVVKVALGMAQIPVFAEQDLAKLAPLKAANLFFCGPEHWQSLDALGRLRHQNEILERLEKLKAQWTMAEMRATANLASRAPIDSSKETRKEP